MTRRMGTMQAATYYRDLTNRLRDAILRAETESGQEAKDIAVEQTSGSLSTKTLRRMGHPYARRAPQTPIDPGKSNDQGGGVPQAWRLEVSYSSTSVRVRVVNSHPDARWLKRAGRGASKSVTRPIIAAVRQRLMPSRRARLRQAIHSALKGKS